MLTCLLPLGDTLDELDRTPTRLSTDPTHNHSSLRLAYTQPGTGSNGVGASRVHAAGVREARKVSSNKKRKRDLQDTIEDDLVDELDLEEQSFPALEATVNNRSQKRLCIAAVKVPGLVYPKSLYHNWDRPSEVSEESKVLREFLVSLPVGSARQSGVLMC